MSTRSDLHVPQRPSPRAPLPLRPTAAVRIRKVSPRAAAQGRIRGTRASDKQTKLGKAEEELKKLRKQLATAEAAKLQAEQALEKGEKQSTGASSSSSTEQVVEEEEEEKRRCRDESQVDSVGSSAGMDECCALGPVESDEEKATDLEVSEVGKLKAELLEKEQEEEILLEWNSIFKAKAAEAAKKVTNAARVREAELREKLDSTEGKMRETRTKADRLVEQLEAAEAENVALENEMKRLRVQAEQWRKAAEVAAAVFAAGEGVGMEVGGRAAERCGSMDSHLGVGWKLPPLTAGDEEEEAAEVGSGRRKSAGTWRFGERWKKKGNGAGKLKVIYCRQVNCDGVALSPTVFGMN